MIQTKEELEKGGLYLLSFTHNGTRHVTHYLGIRTTKFWFFLKRRSKVYGYWSNTQNRYLEEDVTRN